MSFSRQPPNNRRQVYLALASSIESQLRDAYAKRHEAGIETQTSVSHKLGIDRSAVNRRLSGRMNMTIETIADMVWALGHCIDVKIFDPYEYPSNDHRIISEHAQDTGGVITGSSSVTPAVTFQYAS